MTTMRGVIGQRAMLAKLCARAARGEVAHAYGLFGPRSIGKRTVALRIAQTLNCLDPKQPAGGCGSCLSCVKIERGVHPDVRLIERDPTLKDIAIEQVTEMQQDLALRPLEGRKRLVIIDDAGELNLFGQDALLKTLEEPPPHAVLLLITPAAAVLSETIQSRLQPLTFRYVRTAEIAESLTARKIKDADHIAASSGGRPGLGLAARPEGFDYTWSGLARWFGTALEALGAGAEVDGMFAGSATGCRFRWQPRRRDLIRLRSRRGRGRGSGRGSRADIVSLDGQRHCPRDGLGCVLGDAHGWLHMERSQVQVCSMRSFSRAATSPEVSAASGMNQGSSGSVVGWVVTVFPAFDQVSSARAASVARLPRNG